MVVQEASMNDLHLADAEDALLGAALVGADIDELSSIVTAADFYLPANGRIWSAIERVHAAGNKPEPVSVHLAMDAGGDRIDPMRLADLIGKATVGASAPWYAEQVAAAAGHRAIATAGIQLTQLGNKLGDLAERREQARQLVDDACRGRAATKARMLADLLPDVLDVAQHGSADVLSTPWSDVDELIDGLAPGRLIVVGARPGVGKSLMGTNLALHMAGKHKHAVLISSMEMPEREVTQRMLAAHARVNLTGLIKGATDEASWERVAQRHAELDAMPVAIVDTPNQSVQSIRAAARDLQRTRDDLALIVVDYLQLMDVSKADSRAEALGQISRGLKVIARETGACVVALAQVNRESAKRGDRPRMSDLRESGSIEADADQVLLLHQPDEAIPEIEVIVDKNRHGPKGIRTLKVWGHYAQLAQTAWSPSRAVGQ